MEFEHLSALNLAYAVGLAKELHGLGTFGRDGPEFDWSYCRRTMLGVMNDENCYFMLARDESGYVGAVCGKLVTFYFSPKLMGIEDAWYVREGTPRRAAIGVRLMRGFVAWCFDRGAVIVQSVVTLQAYAPLVWMPVYRHMGFTRFGTIYKYARAE